MLTWCPLFQRHTFTDEEKRSYIDAELCLMRKPANLGIRGSRTKFDEFQAAHALQTEIAHFVGQFLPFHRLFVWAHEKALRVVCNYTGSQPYWEEELDAGAFSKSMLLDPILGFGGDGAGPNGCIRDGPFANYTNPIGPGYIIHDHCIERQVNDMFSMAALPAVVNRCMNMTAFLDFWPCIEGGPHGAGHGGIGAEMLNPISSPGDPLFFLHHAWLDKLWWQWQAQDPSSRFKEIGGNNWANLTANVGGPPPGVMPPGMSPPPGGFTPVNLTRPDDVPKPAIYGDPGDVTTLNHLLYLYGMVENRTVSEVMDTSGFLCYQYV
ncbi:hypothetical protein B0H67DRAFT_631880 [Lasiosphaeris hirsuta]|uniref:Tyrosinase copper-binding domain-containing protein n=1 Tax=Lasiosphaeris hirsuta TaxID=260670 RepID=A0AA40BDE1_9PEZI|nr:hypothetical protein B0H67DRAFT_631880 [Lasiosphaeris hirsuta]